VKQQYRVRENKRFQEIRRQGRCYTNELLVMCRLANDLPYSRFGFRIGNAVSRNRIKRRLREAVRLQMDSIQPGWDIVFVARNPIRSADYHEMETACARLLRRAHLLIEPDRNGSGQSGSGPSSPDRSNVGALPVEKSGAVRPGEERPGEAR
jgi:ribonuclease P protein component